MIITINSGNYTFDHTTGQITFANQIPASLEMIRQVNNDTRGFLYYQPQGGLALAGSYAPPILQLNADTSAHNDGDVLTIIYDDGIIPLTNADLPIPTRGTIGTLFQNSDARLESYVIGVASDNSAQYIGIDGDTTFHSINVSVIGNVIDGNAVGSPTGGPVMIGKGEDNNYRALITDTMGQLKVLIQNASAIPVANDNSFLADGGAVTLRSEGLQNNVVPVYGMQIGGDVGGNFQPVGVNGNGLGLNVVGPLTNTELRASAISVNFTNSTIAVTNAGTFAVQAIQSGGWTVTAIAGSGTFAISASSLPLPSGASTAVKQPALGTAGTASIDVITIQGIASMVALKVDGSATTQPVSGTFWQATQPISGTVSITANSSVNVAQLAGTTTDTNSGNKSAGTLRVVLATDQPALTNKILTTPDLPSGASTAAKQPALGTATTPSTDVITTQRPAITQVVSTALETSHVLKSGAGQLVQLTIFNSKVSAQYILLINATSLPSNGAVTLLYPPIPIGASSILVLDLPAPLVASTGIVVANSSTGTFTLTIGSADCVFYAQIN